MWVIQLWFIHMLIFHMWVIQLWFIHMLIFHMWVFILWVVREGPEPVDDFPLVIADALAGQVTA